MLSRCANMETVSGSSLRCANETLITTIPDDGGYDFRIVGDELHTDTAYRQGLSHFWHQMSRVWQTGTPFRLFTGFITMLQVVTTINYNTVTHLQSLHANLFTLSAAVFTYSVSLNHTFQIEPSIHTLHLHTTNFPWLPLKHLNNLKYTAEDSSVKLFENCLAQSQSHIATDGQSVSQ
jgi:hypothetical protein